MQNGENGRLQTPFKVTRTSENRVTWWKSPSLNVKIKSLRYGQKGPQNPLSQPLLFLYTIHFWPLNLDEKIKVSAKMPPLSTSQWSKVVSIKKTLYTTTQELYTFFAKLHDRYIQPSLLLRQNFTPKIWFLAYCWPPKSFLKSVAADMLYCRCLLEWYWSALWKKKEKIRRRVLVSPFLPRSCKSVGSLKMASLRWRLSFWFKLSQLTKSPIIHFTLCIE
jgi:hypothetical protein